MKRKLVIIGASGHGKVVADIAIKINKWKEIVFLDDDESLKESLGLKVLGKTEDAFKYKDDADFFVAIGNNSIRKRVQEKLEKKAYSIATLIHPKSVIGIDVEIGKGSVLMAGVVINSSTKIGKGCIINTSSSIDHDNIIEDYVHISPGANLAGTVKIGEKTWIGIGAKVSNNIEIHSDVVIGAGAVVVKDVTEKGTYIGIPVGKR